MFKSLVLSALLLIPLAASAAVATSISNHPAVPLCTGHETALNTPNRLEITGIVYDSNGHQIMNATVVFMDRYSAEANKQAGNDDVLGASSITQFDNGYFFASVPVMSNCNIPANRVGLYRIYQSP